MAIHEAPPASDALGSSRKLSIHGMISLVLFIAFLAFFAGLMTGAIDGEAVFEPLREAIGWFAGLLNELIA